PAVSGPVGRARRKLRSGLAPQRATRKRYAPGKPRLRNQRLEVGHRLFGECRNLLAAHAREVLVGACQIEAGCGGGHCELEIAKMPLCSLESVERRGGLA